MQFGLVVLDRQVNRLGRLALEDDHVPAGVLHLGAEEAAGIGARDGAGQRALADHGPAAAGRRGGPGQGAGREDHLVVRRQGIDLGIGLLDKVFGRQPPLTQIVVRPLHVEGLAFACSRGQVHTKDFLSPAHINVSSTKASLLNSVLSRSVQFGEISDASSVFAAHSRIRATPVASASTYRIASVGQIFTHSGSPPQRSHFTTLPVSCW